MPYLPSRRALHSFDDALQSEKKKIGLAKSMTVGINLSSMSRSRCKKLSDRGLCSLPWWMLNGTQLTSKGEFSKLYTPEAMLLSRPTWDVFKGEDE